ncbi:MAG TPA: carboxypeptidase-like regulatory domain-containing protein, partial [Allocoleopsis sp.]
SQSLLNQSTSNQLSTENIPPQRDAPNRNLSSKTGVRMGNNPIVVPEKFFGQPLTSNDLAFIQSKISEPALIITASTSGITGSIYDLNLNEFAKQPGAYKIKLFTNKAQYFIDTEIVFNQTINREYIDYYDATVGLRGVASSWNDNLQIIATNSYNHIVDKGPYTGLQVRGNFFTYFTVPDKPVLEYPIMSGQLSTFTPEIRWTNGDKADSFVVQVTYDLTNTGFTGSSVINYPVDKTEENTKTIVNTTKTTDTELATNKNIYNFQFSTKSNKSFLYRIGNSVEIIDIFDVRRNVVTFSDYYQATSQPEPIKTYVKIESDSKFVSEIAGYSTPPSLDYESAVEEFTLSGVVSGSTVTGATLTLTYPNSSFVNTMTDLTGYYSFSGLETGVYTLTTNYRGYQQDVRTVNITGNTSENFKI